VAKAKLKHLISEAETIKIFEEVKDILKDYSIQSVADVSGVRTSTMYFWLDGTTRCPRLDTIVKVAKAMGYELQLAKTEKAQKGTRKTHLQVVK
jgi:DNA-binding phage protein